MIVFLICYIALCLYGARIHKNGNSEYLSMEQTASIKGIFILLVLFSHFNSYVYYGSVMDQTYASFVRWFGQTMVTMFLFYSGYGVMQSITKKDGYVDTIPVKRVLATLFRFDCALLLYFITGLIMRKSFGLKQIMLSLIGWDSIGNSNWYIFVIMLLYAMTYVAFKVIRTKNHLWPVVVILLMSYGWILVCNRMHLREIHWYDTILCYGFGMLYSLYREKIERIVYKNKLIWAGALLLCVYAFMKVRASWSLTNAMLVNLIFTAIVVFITMYISIGNKVLCWCGKNLFELYILQRIPMMLLQYWGLDKVNIYLYFICCVFITIALIKPFRVCADRMWGFLVRKIG